MILLPGVSEEYLVRRLSAGAGNEISSGKIESHDSSAILAANCFGWFWEQPQLLPSFPVISIEDWRPSRVEVEYCARFPWSGGKHPHLDACIFLDHKIVGVESKRLEPFRDAKQVKMSDAYLRPVWGDQMGPFEVARDRLRSGSLRFRYLDAAQLVKHAFGLVTEARRHKKHSSLVYLFAEPIHLANKVIPAEEKKAHRAEIDEFKDVVRGATVEFAAISYSEWLSSWNQNVWEHRNALMNAFDI